MSLNKKILLIAGVVCVLVCAALVLAMCGGQGPSSSQSGNGETATYTIEVKSAGGIALTDVGMYIYEDSTLQELVAFVTTDDAGLASFTDVARDTYVAVLSEIPTGYEAEEYYPITGELTQIVLQAGQMTDVDVQSLTYKLGDAMMDFSVTGPDGTEYTLSQLFEGKKAVVLNFFYNECQPCMLEFPYLQEAYEAYKDDIAVLAMNPVNTDDAAIAAKQKELGVTFPMVKCGSEWESIMQITAYPTTVIIDRFGNICLIHKGSVPDAKTFKDAFAYFAAEDYEQKLIEAIGDLAVEEPEGTKENPTDVGGVTSFEVTVEPGQVVYNDLHKVFGMYLTIRSENAYVIYKDKTYYPENGVISLKVTAPDTYTPATVGFGNSGTKTETFKVSLSIPAGTFNNPNKLTLGEFDAKVAAGNDQGVYYKYTATEDGTFTLQCLSVNKGVKYGFYLYNLDSGTMNNIEVRSASDPSTLSVQAKKGQNVMVCISSLPDDTNSYPAASFKFNATFTAHEIKEEEKIPMTDYTVTILDDSKKPVANISVLVKVDGKDTAFTTNADGVAKISLPTGTYQGSFYVPDGYTAEKTDFELTEKVPNVSLTISPIKQADYTVKVVGPDGEAIANTFVKIGENTWQRTDANGVVTMHLDVADYAVTIMVPAGYTGETAYQFAEGATELTITLGVPETTDPTDPSEPTDPTDPVDPSEPTDPTDPVDPSEPTDPTDPTEPTDPTDPTEPTEPEPEDCVYTVTVLDAFGTPQAGIDVIFMQEGAPVHFATTDVTGMVKLETNSAQTYTVELVFSGTEYYYNKAEAVLSGDNRNLTVKLAVNVDTEDYTEVHIFDNAYPGYSLYIGGTHVELGSGKPNFSAENGNNCFFVFTPTEAGTYQISSMDAEVSIWGTTSYVFFQGSAKDSEDNAITFSISGSTVGNSAYVIGVMFDGNVTDAVVNIARIGEPEFTIADQPWTDWGGTGDAHAGSCKVTASAGVTYVDIKAASGTYDIYYDEAAGYYRFQSNGKPVLVDLNKQGSVTSLYVRINGKDHYGGAAVNKYFFDASGAFVKKEDYTEYLSACFTCAGLQDAEGVGYHVLTKELMYVLQNGFEEWWDPNSPNYQESSFATANKEYIWMFACCMAN